MPAIERPKRYRMKANKGTEAPSNLLFFDTESHPPEHHPDGRTKRLKLRLWAATAIRLEKGIATRRETARGTDVHSFCDFVDKRCDFSRPLWAFAHNLGFDLSLLNWWRELWRKRYTIGPVPRPFNPDTGRTPPPWKGKLCVENRPTFVIAKGDRGTVKLIDTGNYWPTKLVAIGESLGVPKWKMPAWEAPDEEWFAYCENDVQVVEAAVCELLRWWTAADCGVFQLTAAQLSLTNYRHTSQLKSEDGETVDIVYEPDHPATELERDAFYGGRFEAFYVGSIPHEVFKVDVNSLYPFIMATNTFPRRHVGRAPDRSPAGLLRSMQAYGAVATVKIHARGNTYPLRWDGSQIHATGIFWTHLAGPELQRALEAGDVETVGEAYLYSMADLFSEWVKTWYERKKAAAAKGPSAAGELEFCKLVLNSLYGKFAQNGRHWKDRLDLGWQPDWDRWCQWNPETKSDEHFRAIAGVAQELVDDDEPRHAFPAIAAYVTSHAREYMRSVIASLPFESVYYIGTDSLFCDRYAMNQLKKLGLVSDDELGKFRVEGKAESCELLGANNYRFGDTWTRSGIHGRAKEVSPGKFVSEHWQSLPEILSGEPTGEVIITEHPFKETVSTVKGKKKKCGWVRPWWFGADIEWTDKPPKRQSR